MAAALLARSIEEAGLTGIEAESAGIGAWEGAAASEGAYLVMLEQGYDLSGHRARQLTKGLADEADLILTMAHSHLGRVRELGGGARAHLLGEYAGKDPESAEIQDPYGSELEQYRETYRELLEMMPEVVARLRGHRA